MDQNPLGNTGFIAVMPKPGDFIAGAETGILETVVLPTNDWRPYLPTNATQLMKTSDGSVKVETNGCVAFGASQDAETQLNFLIRKGMLSQTAQDFLKENGYINPADGSFFASKRFTVKMSGTDPNNGNSLPNAWNSIRHDGLVPDTLWPMPTASFDALVAQNPQATLEDFQAIYYAPIPQNIIDIGTRFAAIFSTQYEWMVYPGSPASGNTVLDFLGVAPLEIATAVCAGWNTEDPIQSCGPGGQHATLLDFVEANGDYDILDHYVPYQKQFSPTYDITYAMRGVIREAAVTPPAAPFIYYYEVNLTYGAPAGAEVKALQQGLQTVKDKNGVPYMKVGVFGPFGPQTEAALGRFQVDNGIADAPQGHDFGPKTRPALTAALKN